MFRKDEYTNTEQERTGTESQIVQLQSKKKKKGKFQTQVAEVSAVLGW